MMMLQGKGDPSQNHGGYSFLKLPLKLSSTETGEQRTIHTQLEINKYRYNQNMKSVTGTDADLRKLNKEQLKSRLLEFEDVAESEIDKRSRWECVSLLRFKSSQAASIGSAGNCIMFARGVRVTTKMQRKLYLQQVDDLFARQMKALTSLVIPMVETPMEETHEDHENHDNHENHEVLDHPDPPTPAAANIESLAEQLESFWETKQEEESQNSPRNVSSVREFMEDTQSIASPLHSHFTQEHPQPFNPYDSSLSNPSRNNKRIEFSYQHQCENLKELIDEGLGGIMIDKVGEEEEIRVLRKSIKTFNEEEGQWHYTTIYLTDARQIKSFLKRKSKKEIINERETKRNLIAIKKPKPEQYKLILDQKDLLRGIYIIYIIYIDTKVRINQDEVMKAAKDSTKICLPIPEQFKIPVDPVSQETGRYNEVKEREPQTVYLIYIYIYIEAKDSPRFQQAKQREYE